jgi:hypothetical protein
VGSEKAVAAATAPEGWDSAAVGNSLPLVRAGAAGADSKEEAVGVEAAMVEVMEVAEKVGMVGAAVEAAPLVVEGWNLLEAQARAAAARLEVAAMVRVDSEMAVVAGLVRGSAEESAVAKEEEAMGDSAVEAA